MKNSLRLVSILLIIGTIFSATMTLQLRSTEASVVASASKAKDFKVKKGPEVAAKVRRLKESQENVRAALRYFERKGKPPKIDEAFAITGSAPSSPTAKLDGNAVITRASYTQDSSFSDGNVEVIFVPDYSVDGEWQGTVIANRYDDYGSLVEQYVSETILVMPDPNTYAWDEVYEAPVYGGEVQAPISEPGMYTEYNWGTTREEQPQEYMPVSKLQQPGAHGSERIVHAGLVQSRRARVRAWARCSFAWCGGAGIACVGVNLWNAELLAGPCFAVGCGTSMIGCTWGTLWQ